MKYTQRRRKGQNDPETRAMLSFRFRSMYRNIGLSRPDAAKLLHVSERTLHNWETGHHEIPYTAYKLLRLLTRQELPGQAWAGWHITSGVLWSPEGHGFKPGDSGWWSLLCRRASMFDALYRNNRQLEAELAASRASFSSHVPRPVQPVLDLSFGERSAKVGSRCHLALAKSFRGQSPMVITGITYGIPHREMTGGVK